MILIPLKMLMMNLPFQESGKTFANFMCQFGINKLSKILLKTLNSAQNSRAIETGLSHFCKVTATVMGIKFEKLQSRIISVLTRKYQSF